MRSEDRRGRSRAGRYLAKIVLVAGAYFAAARLGLSLAHENGTITAVWAPTGIALAALVVWGVRMWPAVAIGAFLANALGGGDVGVAAVLGITAGNTLEAAGGASLLWPASPSRSPRTAGVRS